MDGWLDVFGSPSSVSLNMTEETIKCIAGMMPFFFRKHRIMKTTQRIPANSANTLMFHKICVLNMGGGSHFLQEIRSIRLN